MNILTATSMLVRVMDTLTKASPRQSASGNVQRGDVCAAAAIPRIGLKGHEIIARG